MDVIVTIALGVMILVTITQIVLGVIYLVLGDGEAKRQGVRKLVIGGALVLMLVLLAGVPACAPPPPANTGVLDGASLQDAVSPPWLWQGADHPEWASCRPEPPSALCTEVKP